MIINNNFGYAVLPNVSVHQAYRKMGSKSKEENPNLCIHSAAFSPASSSVAGKCQKQSLCLQARLSGMRVVAVWDRKFIHVHEDIEKEFAALKVKTFHICVFIFCWKLLFPTEVIFFSSLKVLESLHQGKLHLVLKRYSPWTAHGNNAVKILPFKRTNPNEHQCCYLKQAI